ncbi:MAG: hypothetical protein FWB90_01765 [Fibromonadales bacterium]|nr:hypothetical protein [Fibromonadales bacterium]
MRQINFPSWLAWIDKNLHWLSIPKLPLSLTIIQALGFFLVMAKPALRKQLGLDPNAIFQGEIWRIFTFLAIPLIDNFLVFFVLWFFYTVMVWLEKALGSTLLTAYFLTAWISTVAISTLIGIPIDTFVYMECSFFFALATIVPNKELHLFFILPLAFKWIAAFIAAVLLIVPLFIGAYNKFLLLAFLLFANYLLFFGKDCWILFKKELDKRRK